MRFVFISYLQVRTSEVYLFSFYRLRQVMFIFDLQVETTEFACFRSAG